MISQARTPPAGHGIREAHARSSRHAHTEERRFPVRALLVIFPRSTPRAALITQRSLISRKGRGFSPPFVYSEEVPFLGHF
jgi:hypothetical protein